MGTTTNYSWPIPEDTDLVKDGAEAIRDLGNAIDTSAADFGGGLVHIETVSGSAVSAINVNDVFSATYDNYKIIINVSTNSNNDGQHRLRLRVSGSDAAGSDYFFSSFIKQANATDGSRNGTSQTFWVLGSQDSAAGKGLQSYSLDLINPFLSDYSRFMSTVSTTQDNGSWMGGIATGYHQLQTSYTGFSFITENGTITSTISIFGYRK